MTKEQLATQLNGREYGDEITDEECAAAKAAGLVVIFGYSDDYVELRGAIKEEIGMWDGGKLYLHRGGVLDDPDAVDCDRCLKRLKEEQKKCAEVVCGWSVNDYSWFISPPAAVNAAVFDILEGKEKFCRGIVVELDALPSL